MQIKFRQNYEKEKWQHTYEEILLQLKGLEDELQLPWKEQRWDVWVFSLLGPTKLVIKICNLKGK